MRVAALYDIHGNLPALEAVLDEVRQAGAHRVVVGGDVVPGPMPCEAIALLRDLDLPVQFIQGNGDREVVGWRRGHESDVIPESYRETMRWVARQLHPDEETLLAGWPETVRVQVDGLGEVLFCHATPRNDTEIFTRLTAEERLRPIFDRLNVPLVVCGHTHMQFDRMIGKTRVVNAGSVGMPFADPGAYWLLLGPAVQLRRTPYNLANAAERIRATKYPQAEAFAARNVLQPPSEREMLDIFTKGELTT
jgi:predicted phosphodiesterase